jgi:hypothetical protein
MDTFHSCLKHSPSCGLKAQMKTIIKYKQNLNKWNLAMILDRKI